MQYNTVQDNTAVSCNTAHTHIRLQQFTTHHAILSQKTLERPRTVTQWTPREPSLTAQHTAAQLSPATLSNKERNLFLYLVIIACHCFSLIFVLSIASQSFGRFYHRLIIITHGANWALINICGRYNIVHTFIYHISTPMTDPNCVAWHVTQCHLPKAP